MKRIRGKSAVAKCFSATFFYTRCVSVENMSIKFLAWRPALRRNFIDTRDTLVLME
jgi:hypothetical protein